MNDDEYEIEHEVEDRYTVSMPAWIWLSLADRLDKTDDSGWQDFAASLRVAIDSPVLRRRK